MAALQPYMEDGEQKHLLALYALLSKQKLLSMPSGCLFSTSVCLYVSYIRVAKELALFFTSTTTTSPSPVSEGIIEHS